MDNNAGQLEQSTIGQELNTLRAIISEIKSHVLEQGNMPTKEAANPRASHKLINIRSDIREISKELEDILKAVNLL